MQYLSNKKGFLGFDNKFNFKEKVVIVPFGLEKTVSYGGGTKNGPKEIIKASHQVELYDEELSCEPYKKIGIKTLKPFAIDQNIKKALRKIADVNNEILNMNLFPMTFGGEHSITPGCIKPFVKKFKEICLLHFDAHADLRPEYHGSPYNHACAVYDASKNANLIQVGIRSMDVSEKAHMDRGKCYFDHEIWDNDDWMQASISQMTDKVYLTIDLDAFNPGIMPATGMPEPGGLEWNRTLKYLRKVFSEKDVVGFDIVELAPIKDLHGPNFLAAKLYYKMLCYKFMSEMDLDDNEEEVTIEEKNKTNLRLEEDED